MIRKENMTPRERWLAVFRRQKPDRIPTDYWSTPEFTAKILSHLGCENEIEMFEKLHIDRAMGVNPLYIGPDLPAQTNVYGIQYSTIDYGSGTYDEAVNTPLAKYHSLAEIEKNYTWPNPDWWDYSDIPAQARKLERYPIIGGGSEPFLVYKDLRGQEQAMLDLVEHPDIVEYCLEKLFELAYQNTLRILEKIPGQVTYIYVAEDLGGQTNLMISPVHIRKYLLPGMRRMIDLGHQAGVYIFHHDDGNVTRILPDLVAAGIDLLNPIQWRAVGMDRHFLKQTYGEKLVFHGGVDNQYTLPFGTAEEVRQEVLENIDILGAGGGYIVAPCHNIQPITPVENVIAMYETAYQAGQSD
jgi:uroporphyrinogen decarboxylase